MTVTESLRERKKQQTWLALHKAALSLATEHGVAAVTTEQIATAAGVSPRTFFNYFPTKEAALVGLRVDNESPMVSALESVPADIAPMEALFLCCCELIRHFTEDPDLWRSRRELLAGDATLLRLVSARNHATEQRLVETFARRLGLDDHDPYVMLAVGSAMVAVRTTIHQHGRESAGTSPYDTLRKAFDLLEAGLPVPEHAISS